MSFIIVSRNPRGEKLFAIVDGDGDALSEFQTETEANEAALNIPVCQAWSYDIVEVNL